MPRNPSGVYSLPSGNPVMPGTLIESAWANITLADVAAALTASLPRDGSVGMLGPLILFRNGVAPMEAVTVLQAFTNPTFTGTTTEGVKIAGTKLTVTALSVQLPAGTAIGSITGAELAQLAGLTGNIQSQIDGKVDKVSGTAADLALTGIPTAPTPPSGVNSTQVANMAAVLAAAFNSALPLQEGNAGKFVTTDGANARWDYIVAPPIAALSLI